MPDEQAIEQPDTGQDENSSQTNGLYPDLSSLDDATRAAVEPILREWDGNVTQRFQQAAEFRKQWEPYEALNLNSVPVEDLERLIAFRDVAADEDRFREWWEGVGREMGLLDAPVEDPEDVNKAIEQALSQRLAPIEAAFTQQQESARLAEAEAFVTSKLDALAGTHGEFDRDAVCQLALAYDGDTAIEQGFKDYQRIVGAAETGVLQSKVDAPAAPESGGTPATQVQPVTTFEEAKEQARAALRHAMSH